MKIAYFSPLSPLKSGISDYSEELLPFLKKYIDIDVFIDQYKPTNTKITKQFKIFNFNDFLLNHKYMEYDEIIYHIGNNTKYHEKIYDIALQIPGIVVLHDYSIHHLIAEKTVAQNKYEEYVTEMEYQYGETGKIIAIESLAGKRRVIWETNDVLSFPANKRILNNAKGVIVHSQFIGNLINSIIPDLPICFVPLHTSEIEMITLEEKRNLKRKYNIPDNKVIFASFGFVTEAKRIDVILRCMKKIIDNNNENFIYLIVGEEAKGVYEMSKYIKQLGLSDNARYLGFVELEELKDYIRLSDVCINLRYPTSGETSASLIRILGMGKPALVTNIGSFSEMPDEFCIKTNPGENEENEIYSIIQHLLEYPAEVTSKGKAAYNYVAHNHTLKGSAIKYYNFIKDVSFGRVYKNNVYGYSNSINFITDKMFELGIDENDNDFIKFITDKLVDVI